MSINKKIVIMFFSMLVLVGTQFVYAAASGEDEEPIEFYLKNIIPSPVPENSGSADKKEYEIVLKIINRSSVGTARIGGIRFTPSSGKKIKVISVDASKCSLLGPGGFCQATATILADEEYVNGAIPIKIPYVMDKAGIGSGLAHSKVSLDRSIQLVASNNANNSAISNDNDVNNLTVTASSENTNNLASIDDKNLDFTTSYSKLTFKNVSRSPIKITKISLESDRATASWDESYSQLGANASCEVAMTLNWGNWFNFFDKSDKDDYIVVNYEDADGNAKQVFLPINTFVNGNKVFWCLTGVVVVAVVIGGAYYALTAGSHAVVMGATQVPLSNVLKECGYAFVNSALYPVNKKIYGHALLMKDVFIGTKAAPFIQAVANAGYYYMEGGKFYDKETGEVIVFENLVRLFAQRNQW